MSNESRIRAFLRTLISIAALALTCNSSIAQAVSEGHLTYAIGAILFRETPRMVMMYKGARLLGTSNILPGGWLSPPISASEDGHIQWGTHEFDIANGNEIKTTNNSQCITQRLHRPGVLTTRHGEAVVTVSPIDDGDQRTVAYKSEAFRRSSCRLIERQRISSPDTDHFFELGSSKAGIWLVGSASNGTLLIRSWAGTWTRIPPPPEINGILTVHWASDGQIWALANTVDGDQVKPSLFVSRSRGQEWKQLPADISSLPKYWLEAIRQLSVASQP